MCHKNCLAKNNLGQKKFSSSFFCNYDRNQNNFHIHLWPQNGLSLKKFWIQRILGKKGLLQSKVVFCQKLYLTFKVILPSGFSSFSNCFLLKMVFHLVVSNKCALESYKIFLCHFLILKPSYKLSVKDRQTVKATYWEHEFLPKIAVTLCER